MKVFIDTNIWVYAYDTAEPQKRDAALRALEDLTDDSTVVSAQVLNEFFAVVTRKLAHPLDRSEAAAAVEMMSALTVVPTNASILREAIELAERWSLSHWDALIVAAARRGRCQRILSEDLAAGSTIDGIEIVNPLL